MLGVNFQEFCFYHNLPLLCIFHHVLHCCKTLTPLTNNLEEVIVISAVVIIESEVEVEAEVSRRNKNLSKVDDSTIGRGADVLGRRKLGLSFDVVSGHE